MPTIEEDLWCCGLVGNLTNWVIYRERRFCCDISANVSESDPVIFNGRKEIED